MKKKKKKKRKRYTVLLYCVITTNYYVQSSLKYYCFREMYRYSCTNSIQFCHNILSNSDLRKRLTPATGLLI